MASTATRPNPLKLNALQAKTLAILQVLAGLADYAEPADAEGRIVLRQLPRAHGDHVHLGAGVIAAKDANGLFNPAVYGALERKGLAVLVGGGRPALTAAGAAYDTGMPDLVHGTDH